MRALAAFAICFTAAAQPTVTWSEHIAPILDRYCVECHRVGQSAPFSLLTYEDARRRADQIAAVTRRRYMPPWLPQHGYGDIAGERRLTNAQLDLIEQWARAGAPRGDPSHRPAPPSFPSDWTLGTPDLVIEASQPLQIPADGPDVFWNFVLRRPVVDTRFVRAIEIRPGNTRVVHHANLLVDRERSSRRREVQPGAGFPGMDLTFESDAFEPDSHFLFWKPGAKPSKEPEDMAWRLDPTGDLVLNVHVRPSGKPESLRPSVGLYFTATPPSKTPMLLKIENDRALDIPADSPDFVVADDFRLPVDVDVLALYPHAHYLGRLLDAFATLPDGERRPLIRIPDWDVNWQAVYTYRAPVFLPKGTVVSMRYHYDNSVGNPRNPNSPPRRVRSGNQAADEMGHLWLQVLPHGPGDRRAALQEALLRHRLEKHSDDAAAHLGLGALLLGRKETTAAEVELREALRLSPRDPEALNNLGAALKLEGRSGESLSLFEQALELRPDYANARFNLAAALAEQGSYDEAARHLRTLLASVPTDREARAQLVAALIGAGSAAMSNGKLTAATESYRELVTLDPTNPDYRNNFGLILARKGDVTGAIAQFEEALRADPSHAPARRNLDRLRERR